MPATRLGWRWRRSYRMRRQGRATMTGYRQTTVARMAGRMGCATGALILLTCAAAAQVPPAPQAPQAQAPQGPAPQAQAPQAPQALQAPQGQAEPPPQPDTSPAPGYTPGFVDVFGRWIGDS